MSGVSTATVQALTAEVRVLMVGSRQVTLSVVRQLDPVLFQDLEPFGRIRVAGWHNAVIGRSLADGTLVVARYPEQVTWKPNQDDPDDIALHTLRTAHHERAAALPLIVLAGLR